MRHILAIGHRGAAAHAPENTLLSFQTAWKMGADMIELDIRSTADGHVVCIHDEDLVRTCHTQGRVGETTLEVLRSLDAGRGERIPLLSEVLDFARGRVMVNIEIKEQGVELAALDMVAEREMLNEVLFSSFIYETLVRIRDRETEAKTGMLYAKPPDDPVAKALEIKADAMNPLFLTVTPELVERAHSAGLKVYVWTVNDADVMTELLAIGVDGIISDMPDLARTVVDEYVAGLAR